MEVSTLVQDLDGQRARGLTDASFKIHCESSSIEVPLAIKVKLYGSLIALQAVASVSFYRTPRVTVKVTRSRENENRSTNGNLLTLQLD